MQFLSATQIGKKHGLSYQKINKILTAEGLIDAATKKPSSKANESELTKICSTKSQFTLEVVEFIAWDYTKLKILFPAPVKKLKKAKLRTTQYISVDPFDEICEVFSKFGEILEIEVHTPKIGLSKEAADAVVESYFSDPDFIGGTKFFHRPMYKADATLIKNIVLPLASELYEAAKKVSATKAKANLLKLDEALSRLHEKAL